MEKKAPPPPASGAAAAAAAAAGPGAAAGPVPAEVAPAPPGRAERTRRRLLDALAVEIALPHRLGVERVAARAGVNKSLVYRYFGGLPGLVAAFAASDRFMPGVEELRALLPPGYEQGDARARFAACATAYLRALAGRPASVALMLRLPLIDAPVAAALQEGRQAALAGIRALFGPPDPSFPADRELLFALLIGGACQVLGHGRRGWTAAEEPPEALVAALLQGFALLLAPSAGVPPSV